MKTITSIGHVAIRVKDIDLTLAFYHDKLGFEEMFRTDREGKLWIVYLRITDTQFLEIFPNSEGECAPAEQVGPNHFCLTVSNLDNALAELEQAGVTLFREKKRGMDGNLQAWIQDPDGIRIEIMEMAEDGKQAIALERRRQGLAA